MKIYEKDNPWKTLSSQAIYDNPWISLTEYKVLNPSGNPGIYSVVNFKNLAIGIIPLDEEYNTWIVGQYRYPLKQYSWEIPEGGGKLDVDPIESARRELLEEAGIKAEHVTLIQESYLSNSVSDEKALIYVAQGLSFEAAQPEETEQLEIKKIPFNELYKKVSLGEITDSLTVIAVLKIKLMMMEGVI
jgi:8-oxo-dGTP pyrophosphatase MutT (NUDIX family)